MTLATPWLPATAAIAFTNTLLRPKVARYVVRCSWLRGSRPDDKTLVVMQLSVRALEAIAKAELIYTGRCEALHAIVSNLKAQSTVAPWTRR
jgi:hypothetical protein